MFLRFYSNISFGLLFADPSVFDYSALFWIFLDSLILELKHFSSRFYFWVLAAKEDASTAHARCASALRCRLWLNAYRICALVAEVSRGWRALFVHLSLWHEVHGAGEGSLSQSAGRPGEIPLEQLAISEESQPKFWSASRNTVLTSLDSPNRLFSPGQSSRSSRCGTRAQWPMWQRLRLKMPSVTWVSSYLETIFDHCIFKPFW